MKTIRVRELVLGALGIALVFLATLLLKIPNAMQGYINMGDGFLLLFASFLSPAVSFVIGAAGSALADIAGGYGYYALFTLLIKGCEGALVSFCLSKVFRHPANVLTRILIYAAAACVMIGGYFFADTYVNQSWQLAAAATIGNILQGSVGILIAVIAYPLLEKQFKKE